MIRPLFDATDQVSLTIADDRLRRGAQLVNTTSRNIELFVDMARRHLIMGSGGGIDDRSEIQDAAHAKSLWDHNNGLITSAEAPYDTVVAEHFPAEFVGVVHGHGRARHRRRGGADGRADRPAHHRRLGRPATSCAARPLRR